MGTKPMSSLRVISFEGENFTGPLAGDSLRVLERLVGLWVLGSEIQAIELYACMGAGDVQRLFRRVTVTDAKASPRF